VRPVRHGRARPHAVPAVAIRGAILSPPAHSVRPSEEMAPRALPR
jgi:hypothetical protein